MRTNPLSIGSNEKVLIVSPHPDDESIGVGGLLLLYGKQCSVYVMTDGRYGNSKYLPEEMAGIREKELASAMKMAGISRFKAMGVEDGKLINTGKVFDDIGIDEYDVVFVPNPDDNHSDHTACYKYVIDYIKEKELRNIRTYIYEVHTPLRDADCHLDITDVISHKTKMVECYKSQMEMHSYNKQIIKLAEYRGFQNERDGRFLEVYKRIDVSGVEGVTSNTDIELAKYRTFTRLLRQWLGCANDVGRLSGYLLSRDIRKVAIYGYGILGRTLHGQLEGTTCHVEYIIDKNEGIDCEIKKYSDVKSLEYVDLIIITAVLDVEDIKKEIEEKSGIKCIGIEELISSLERDINESVRVRSRINRS